jgi:hypothetical protein
MFYHGAVGLAACALSARCFLVARGGGVVCSFYNLIDWVYIIFTTRSWSSAAALLCALLLQNCRSNSLRAIAEEDSAAGSSSVSAVCQCASSEIPAMQPLTPLGTLPTAHITLSRLSTTPTNKEDLFTVLSTRSLSPSMPFALATMSNSLAGLYDLPAATMPRAYRAVSSDNTPGHAPSPDGPGVCVSKVEGVLREMLSDEEEDSKLPARLRSSGSKDELVSEGVRAGEDAEPDKAEEVTKDVRLLALKTLEEVTGEHCGEQRGQSEDPLTILLNVASSKPNKAIQFLDLLLVAAQDNDLRQQP